MEERSKALMQGEEQFNKNVATLLKEMDLMKRETNGITK